MTPSQQPAPTGCTGRAATAPARVSLPVLGVIEPAGPGKPPKLRKSRNGPRRALILGLVHLIFAAHIAHWLLAGRTVSPVEPSEAMYTLETGVINAGFLFFAVAILSTLIFGRFFCGWGCHVVALQDLCAWLLKKVGVRPKPFRSRLLIFVPLFFAFYMFLWPTLRRELLAPLLERHWPAALAWIGPVHPFPGFTVELMVEDFWATFAGPLVAVPFLFVCGFAAVYFLGSKGFCTYGCPYGGIFGPVDRLSPGRIVVDHNKCEGCGHCTASCTSNVRVHEEIRDFGMVVNPGCMKCMDCVSVCPNDALAFKFAAPEILKSRKRGRSAKPTPPRQWDLSWPEELLLVAVFALAFVASRGLYGLIPLLFAIGIAGCVTYIFWKLLRLALDRDLRLHNFQLRRAGRLKPAGWAFLALGSLTVLLTLHSAAVQAMERYAGRFDALVTVPAAAVFTPARQPLPDDQRAAAQRAIDWYTRASSFRVGGVALAGTPAIDVRLAWLHAAKGDHPAAEAALRRIMARGQMRENLARHMLTLLALQGRPADGEAFLRDALRRHPEFEGLLADFAASLLQRGAAGDADAAAEGRRLFTQAIERQPWDAELRARFGAALLAVGSLDEGVAELRASLDARPDNPAALQQLAAGLLMQSKPEDALAALDRAILLDPADPVPAVRAAQILQSLKRNRESLDYLDKADAAKKLRAQRAAERPPAPDAPRPRPSGTRAE